MIRYSFRNLYQRLNSIILSIELLTSYLFITMYIYTYSVFDDGHCGIASYNIYKKYCWFPIPKKRCDKLFLRSISLKKIIIIIRIIIE